MSRLVKSILIATVALQVVTAQAQQSSSAVMGTQNQEK